MFCPNCGAEIPDNSILCANCGAAITIGENGQPQIQTEYNMNYGEPAVKGFDPDSAFNQPGSGPAQQAYQQDTYAQQNQYAQQDPYAQQNQYAQQDPYAQQDQYAQQNQYAQQDPYAQQNQYAQQNPYMQQNPYGPGGYNQYGPGQYNPYMNNPYNPYARRAGDDGMSVAIKVFLILGCIFGACCYLIPLAWMIPMTIHAFKKLDAGEELGIGFKICTLIFLSKVGGILMFVRDSNSF